MPAKSLNKTNPYLSDPAKRAQGLWTSVSSSSVIEGIHVTKAKVIGEAATPPHGPEASGKSPR